MEYALFTIMILAVWHLIWESIIAPALRLGIRYELFELRDELRKLKIEHENDIPNDTFSLVDKSINGLLNHMPQYNFSALWNAIVHAKENPKYDQQVKDRAAMLSACSVGDVDKIYKKTMEKAMAAFTINVGGWLPVLIPIALISLLIDGYKLFAQQIQKLVLANEKQWKQGIDSMYYGNGVSFS